MSKKCRVGLIVAIVLLVGTQALHLSAVSASDGVPVSGKGVTGGGVESLMGSLRAMHGAPCMPGGVGCEDDGGGGWIP